MFGRKKKKLAKAAKSDPFGGFSLDQLLGLDPIVHSKKEKKQHRRSQKKQGKGAISKLIGLPLAIVKAPVTIVHHLIGGVVNALVEVLKLPVRVLGGLARPWRRN